MHKAPDRLHFTFFQITRTHLFPRVIEQGGRCILAKSSHSVAMRQFATFFFSWFINIDKDLSAKKHGRNVRYLIKQKGVKMILSRVVTGAPLVLACAAIIIWSTQAGAAASSSCVTCHLDEDMLTETLAQVNTKASAMQSGAG